MVWLSVSLYWILDFHKIFRGERLSVALKLVVYAQALVVKCPWFSAGHRSHFDIKLIIIKRTLDSDVWHPPFFHNFLIWLSLLFLIELLLIWLARLSLFTDLLDLISWNIPCSIPSWHLALVPNSLLHIYVNLLGWRMFGGVNNLLWLCVLDSMSAYPNWAVILILYILGKILTHLAWPIESSVPITMMVRGT